jgi:hypothetical protein
MYKFFFALLLLAVGKVGFSQDTLLMINGRKVIAASISLEESKIVYRKATPEYIIIQNLRKNNGSLPLGLKSTSLEICGKLQMGKWKC